MIDPNSCGPIILISKMYYYYFNYLNITEPAWWLGPKLMKLSEIPSMHHLRYVERGICFANAGWHFSFIGGIKRIIEKVQNYSHQEYNNDEILDEERLLNLIKSGQDIFGRDYKYQTVPLDNSFPLYIIENRERFSHLILEP